MTAFLVLIVFPQPRFACEKKTLFQNRQENKMNAKAMLKLHGSWSLEPLHYTSSSVLKMHSVQLRENLRCNNFEGFQEMSID